MARSSRTSFRVRIAALVTPLLMAALVAASPRAVDPPDVAEPKVTGRAEEAGGFSVSERSGTANWSYRFTLPPARGPKPDLSLSYSSSGAVHGDVAQGFTLSPVMVIRRDVAREQTVSDRQYTAYFGGAVAELIATSGDVTAAGGQPYRARIDHDFTRFEKVGGTSDPDNPSALDYWIAKTTDGRTFYFGDDPGVLSGTGRHRLGQEWYLSRIVDTWGNEVDYEYQLVQWPHDGTSGSSLDNVNLLLSAISYSPNRAAGIPAHARVELSWQLGTPCLPASGLQLPVGATIDYRTGARRIRGTHTLTAVVTKVADTPGSWREVHRWTMHYDDAAARCDRAVSPRRRLVAVDEQGTAVGAQAATLGPTTRFTYGRDPDPLPPPQPPALPPPWPGQRTLVLPPLVTDSYSTGRGVLLSGLSVSGSAKAMSPVYSMLADMDGDGRPDLVRSFGGSAPPPPPGSALPSSGGPCGLTWYRNLGDHFDNDHPQSFPLPFDPLPNPTGVHAAVGDASTPVHWEAECSLAGAWQANFGIHTDACFGDLMFEHRKLYYRFVDFDGDGKTDLLAAPYRDDGDQARQCQQVTTGGQAGQPPQTTHPQCCVGDTYSAPYSNTAAGDPTCPAGSYPWRYYKNQGGWISASPTMSFCAPVAMAGLPPLANSACPPEQPRCRPQPPEKQLYDIADLNGDRRPELISQSYVSEQLIQETNWAGQYDHILRWCATGTPTVQFNVWLNSGTQFVWPNTAIMVPPVAPYGAVDACQDGSDRILDGTLTDINGDGLADFITTGNGQPVSWGVFYNQGFSFEGSPTTIVAAPSNTDWAPQQEPPAFPRDLDLDGIADLSCLADWCRTSFGDWGIAFGNGAGFGRASSGADQRMQYVSDDGGPEFVGRTAKIQQVDDPNLKFKRSLRDFMDLDGDGVPERLVLLCSIGNCPTGTNPNALAVEYWPISPGEAPGLLAQIDNGHGGLVRFSYTRSTDTSVVTMNQSLPSWAQASDWIAPSMPFATWVVSQTQVSDDNGGTWKTTKYQYQDPVLLADSGGGAKRFRGFQAATVSLPANAGEGSPQTFERYTYALDPDGVLDYKALYEWPFNGTRFVQTERTVDQTVYISEPVLGVCRSVHPQSTTHIECSGSGDCNQQQQFRTTTTYSYTPFAADGTRAGDSAHTVLYGNEATVEDTTTFDGQTVLERKHEADHLVIDTPTTYFVLAKKKVEWFGSGAPGSTAGSYATSVVALENYFYDGSTSIDRPGSLFAGGFKGALTRTRVYRDLSVGQINGDQPCRTAPRTDMTGAPSEPVCVDHGTTYDPAVGNKLREVKPSAMTQAGGDPTRASVYTEYAYDSNYKLLPIRVSNEAGHTVLHTYDFGSGQVLVETGPNFKSGTICAAGGSPCSVTTVYARRSYQYDGLGRLMSETDSQDDPAQMYVEKPVRTLTYPDFSTVLERHALDWGFTKQTLAKKQYDGHGKLVWVTIALDGQTLTGNPDNPVNAEVHVYAYDARNNLASVTDPDPSTDGAMVTHTFTHDARGRLTSVTAPDGAQITTTYAPWEKTVRDADGGVNHQVVDGFGLLRQVDESGSASGDVAHTFYDYDGAGRLAKVHDADQHDTILAHDGEGHRRMINRLSGRNWLYSYDADGNLVRKEDPDHRLTQYGYDALGRVLVEDVLDAKLPAGATAADLGLGRTVYTYDQGANATGKLARVALFDHLNVAATDVPYAAVDYGYDSLGDRARDAWTLSLPATGTRQLAIARTYGPQGNIAGATYPTGQAASWSYDGRSKTQSVVAAGQTVATYVYNIAGLPKTRQASGQARSYGYDQRGRLLTDALAIGPSSLGRTFAYSPDGDVQSIRVQDALGDRPALDTTMTFRYDALHRLTEARGGTGLSYEAGLSYSPAGNIASATVLGAASEPDRSQASGSTTVILGGGVAVKPVSVAALSLARSDALPAPAPVPAPPPPIPPGVTYEYGDGVAADTQAVTGLRAGSSYLAQFVYDKAGNMTDRLTQRWSSLSAHYVYDTNDQVRRVSNSAGRSERYYYLDHQRFLAVADDGSWRFYLGGEYELDVTPGAAGKEEHSIYVAAGEPVARLTSCTGACQSVAPPTTLVYHDRRGDLFAAVAPNGAVQSHFIYGAFGEVLYQYQANDPNASDWRRRFNGKEWDSITGLVYYGYRFYDPLTLRWTSADPLYRFAPDVDLAAPQRLNVYSFSMNTPLVLRDSNGLDAYETETQARRRVGKKIGLEGDDLDAYARTGNAPEGSFLDPALFGGVDITKPLTSSQQTYVSKWITGNTNLLGGQMIERLAVFRNTQAEVHWAAGNYGEWIANRAFAQVLGGGDPKNNVAALKQTIHDLNATAVYRGGRDMTLKPNEYKVDENGMVKPLRGISVNTDPAGLEKFGGAQRIRSVPSELQIIQVGKSPTHHEIIPVRPIPPAEFQRLLNEVKFFE